MGATAAVAGSAILGAYATYQQGQANANIAESNARIREMQAADALNRGEEAESRHRVGVRQLIGEQRAAFAAQGVTLDDGSALEVVADTAYQAELDALTIRNNAAREAWGYRVAGQNLRDQAAATRDNAGLSALSSIAGGGAQTYGTYRRLNG